MITNFNELTIAVKRTLSEIEKKQYIIRECIYSLDFDKVKEFHSFRLGLFVRISKMIADFRESLENNYLEKRLFEANLNRLENSLPSKALSVDVFFCVAQLNKQYLKLKEEEMNLILEEMFEGAEKIKQEKEVLIANIECILIQSKVLCGNFEDEKKETSFFKILDYFGFNFSERKEVLKLKLKDKQRILRTKSIQQSTEKTDCVTYEIQEIETEIESLNYKLLLLV